MVKDKSTYDQELKQIIESATRLGIELDEAEALQWLTAISAAQQEDITIDEKSGVYGHRITMLDFSDEDLAHFRRIGKMIEFDDIPGKVETALSLSGSAAQSKVQTYPGDADFFERVNIYADTREEACKILGDIMHEKALSSMDGPYFHLIEVKIGSYPHDFLRDGKLQSKGSPISWQPEDIKARRVSGTLPDGTPEVITWEDAAKDPGWCKLDWVVADPVRKQLVNASNMLDVTWEAPDSSITPLDGYLDSFFQEVYLDAESIPIFSKLVKHVSGDALDNYVDALRNEVKKYVTKHPNYGKVAKRLYNIFRLTGKYPEAAYLRELFDEPTAMLYQIGALVRTVEEGFEPGSDIDIKTLASQTDELIMGVVNVLDGPKETEIVRHLLQMRDLLDEDARQGQLSPQVSAVQAEIVNLVNNFFYEKLTAVPTIREYIDEITKE
jgi:hypothetical protein